MKAQNPLSGRGRWSVLALALTLLLLLSLPGSMTAGELLLPPDPTADIAWSAGYSGVADIQTAFNNARTTENAQLGTSMPMLTMPSQATWDTMSNGDKALWLIQRERAVRGVYPMEGLEANVNGVAQAYATYLLVNDATGHTADGSNPTARMYANPVIGACHDTYTGENLAYFWSSSGYPSLPVERAVYMWIYQDSGLAWGHRHLVMNDTFNDNACLTGQAGFMGIGRATGGPHQGWPYAEIICMDVFDPCATWTPCGPTAAELADFEVALGGGFGMLVSLAGVGLLVGVGVIASVRRRKE
jgi:hypothetical protein